MTSRSMRRVTCWEMRFRGILPSSVISYDTGMAVTFYKTRACRQQNVLMPARIEDYVAADNAVRAIEAYILSRAAAAEPPVSKVP